MFDDITVESIKNDILNDISAWDTREGSFCNTLISPTAYRIWETLQSLNAVIPIAFVDETSGIYIDKRAAEYGIYRKEGTKASAEMTFWGKAGTTIKSGSVFLTDDGKEYILDNDVVINDTSITATVTALDIGEIYNTPENTINSLYSAINGLERFTNTTAAIGGTNQESDESLVNRLYEYWRMPASSGNVYHYKIWAKEVDGVGEAKVFPLWNGNGTVKIIICSSQMLSCSEDIVSQCKVHIENLRPIGADVTVESAQEKEINIDVNITTDNTRSIEDIKSEIEKKVTEYFKSIAFKTTTVLYNQIGYLILDTAGVIDFSNLTLNGESSNISIGENEIAVKGAFIVNE